MSRYGEPNQDVSESESICGFYLFLDCICFLCVVVNINCLIDT